MNKKEYEKPRIETVRVEIDSILATTSPDDTSTPSIPIEKPGGGGGDLEPGEDGYIWGD